MQQAVECEVRNMDGQQLSNVFLACAYLKRQPDAGTHRALFSALQRKRSDLVSQAAANVVWAAGKLSMQLTGEQQQLLMKLLKQHTRGVTAQEGSNAWLGLAYLEVQLDAQISKSLPLPRK